MMDILFNDPFFSNLAAIGIVIAFGAFLIGAGKHDREVLKRDTQAMAERFNADVDAILESFSNSPNREELVRRELEIDSFEWYWNDIAGSQTVNDVVQNKLYPAFYDKLKYFNLKNQVAKIVPES